MMKKHRCKRIEAGYYEYRNHIIEKVDQFTWMMYREDGEGETYYGSTKDDVKAAIDERFNRRVSPELVEAYYNK